MHIGVVLHMSQKQPPIRMQKLRDAARGQDCLLQVPNVCNGDPDTTVLCHVPSHVNKGANFKPDDCLGVDGCSACHDFIDGRTHINGTTRQDRMEIFNNAFQKQVVRWLRRGVLS